ncbi:MAG: hypothetical protein VW622_05195 [Opitutae bacterium]
MDRALPFRSLRLWGIKELPDPSDGRFDQSGILSQNSFSRGEAKVKSVHCKRGETGTDGRVGEIPFVGKGRGGGGGIKVGRGGIFTDGGDGALGKSLKAGDWP